ncbi:hypothetical protein AN958_01851 [Leucoagaricus sp. SymC.cos]|nr:hypothetical protein AN958_01851 [Leucoagaricus sp. SymC.cos]
MFVFTSIQHSFRILISAVFVQSGTTSNVMSHEDMMNWLETTDANLTYVGEPTYNQLPPGSAQETTVVFCNRLVGNDCGGNCTVVTGKATCLPAPGTKCLAATQNVGFCDRGGCGHSCHQLSNCGTYLNNGEFCSAPGTESIVLLGN